VKVKWYFAFSSVKLTSIVGIAKDIIKAMKAACNFAKADAVAYLMQSLKREMLRGNERTESADMEKNIQLVPVYIVECVQVVDSDEKMINFRDDLLKKQQISMTSGNLKSVQVCTL
jgi:hypothetical protein